MAKPIPAPSPSLGLIDRKKVAAHLCCSIATIKRIEKRGELQRVQIGLRMVRYRLEDVLKLEGSNVP
jgi:hypothetical protein